MLPNTLGSSVFILIIHLIDRMKDSSEGDREGGQGQARRDKWRAVFKRRLQRQFSQRSETSDHSLQEWDSDRASQTTSEQQNNVDYFDFSFIEE